MLLKINVIGRFVGPHASQVESAGSQSGGAGSFDTTYV
jgi:hypothetical protein